MPWFKVDDAFAMHPKALRAGNAAIGLWVRAGAYSMQHLTDGFVANDVVSLLGTVALADKLVSVGLWEKVSDTGYRFHEWTQRQPSKAVVEKERATWRKRQEDSRERRRREAEAAAAKEATG